MGLTDKVKALEELAHEHVDTGDIQHTNQLGRVVSRVNFPAPTSGGDGGGGSSIYFAKITDAPTANSEYPADIYSNMYSTDPTYKASDGATIIIPDTFLDVSQTVPVDSWIPVASMTVGESGDGQYDGDIYWCSIQNIGLI